MSETPALPLDTVFTEDQLAEHLNIPRRTLRDHRQGGVGIPFTKIGGAIRYLLRDVSEYIESQRRTSTRDQ